MAQFLRDRRGSIPYSTLAKHSAWGASTLKRAAAGKALPTWDCVQGYLAACGITNGPGYDDAGWLYVSAYEACKRRPKRWGAAPRPDLAASEADLSRALRAAYEAAGRPSIRDFVERVGDYHLPRTTAHRIMRGQAMPVDVSQYLSFLQACGIPGRALPAWFDAWSRIRGVSPFLEIRRISPLLDGVGVLYLRWLENQKVYPPPAWYQGTRISAAA
ncbi:hypothetical protein [Streptomyces sp. NPDC001717]|uniref:hypothetical protein n=1 Tax=Streptomyces sp. NPDC001717 TaxID=3364604 RepID=UPI003688AA64